MWTLGLFLNLVHLFISTENYGQSQQPSYNNYGQESSG